MYLYMYIWLIFRLVKVGQLMILLRFLVLTSSVANFALKASAMLPRCERTAASRDFLQAFAVMGKGRERGRGLDDQLYI